MWSLNNVHKLPSPYPGHGPENVCHLVCECSETIALCGFDTKEDVNCFDGCGCTDCPECNRISYEWYGIGCPICDPENGHPI